MEHDEPVHLIPSVLYTKSGVQFEDIIYLL